MNIILQIQEIYGEAGIWGFWKGVLPTLIMVCWKWISFMPEGVLLIACSLTQVSNPSIQFMLYEAMLAKLRKRRAWSKKGSNGVTALEVLCQFANLHKISFDWCPIYMFSLILPLIVYYIFLLIFPYDTRYFLLEL